jgi:integrase
MAFVRRLPGSKFWIGGFNSADGRRVQRSTKQTSRKAALKIAEQWEEAARQRITESQAHKVISDIVETVHGKALDGATLAEHAESWLRQKRGEVAETTFKAYEGAIRSLLAFVGPKAAQPIRNLSSDDVASWRAHAAAKATPRTASNKLKIVRMLLWDAFEEGKVAKNVARSKKIKVLKSPPSARRPITLDELERILDVASVEWYGMALLGFYTGQRLRDLAGLRWSNVDLVGGRINLVTAKTQRAQSIPMHGKLRWYLESLASSDDPRAPIFPSLAPHASTANGASRLSQQFHECLVDAGLVLQRAPKDVSTGTGRTGPRVRSPLSFHSFRHTATSQHKNASIPELVVRDLIGHTSEAVSQIYTHVDDEVKRRAIAAMPYLKAEPRAWRESGGQGQA